MRQAGAHTGSLALPLPCLSPGECMPRMQCKRGWVAAWWCQTCPASAVQARAKPSRQEWEARRAEAAAVGGAPPAAQLAWLARNQAAAAGAGGPRIADLAGALGARAAGLGVRGCAASDAARRELRAGAGLRRQQAWLARGLRRRRSTSCRALFLTSGVMQRKLTVPA